MEQPAIDEVGFFHFGKVDKADPIESLEVSLRAESTRRRLNNCLLVLPEAFNFRRGYLDCSADRPDGSIRLQLAELSRELGVAFVSGLIQGSVDDQVNSPRGYSCSYLIDGEVEEVLSFKSGRDWNDPSCAKYTESANPCDKAILHREICVASLICMDGVADSRPTDRQAALLQAIQSARKQFPAVLCIPARMTMYTTLGIAREWARWLNKLTVVVANAAFKQGYPSVILDSRDEPTCVEGETSTVCFVNARE